MALSHCVLLLLWLLLPSLCLSQTFKIHLVTLEDGTISIMSNCPGSSVDHVRKGVCIASCPKGTCSSKNPVQALTDLDENIDSTAMATTSGGKILLAYRGNCIGGSPCVAECAEPTCSDLQGIGLDEVIHSEGSNGTKYKLPGFASAMAFDQDDYPVLTYLEKLKQNEHSNEVIVWKIAMCNHSRCDGFEIRIISELLPSQAVPEKSTLLVAFDSQDALHATLIYNDTMRVMRCVDSPHCSKWQQTNMVFFPQPVRMAVMPNSALLPGEQRTIVVTYDTGATQSLSCSDDFMSCSFLGVLSSSKHAVSVDIATNTQINVDGDGNAVKMLTTAVASFATSNVSSVTLVTCADSTCYVNTTKQTLWSHLYTEREQEKHHRQLGLISFLPQVAIGSQLDSPRPFVVIRTAVDGAIRSIQCQSVDCSIFQSLIIADNSTKIVRSQSNLRPLPPRTVDWAVVGSVLGVIGLIILLGILSWIGKKLKKQAKQVLHETKREKRKQDLANRQMRNYGSIQTPPPLLGSMNAASEDYTDSEKSAV